jgi:drug/metabolite transporter (DMT)-like permease
LRPTPGSIGVVSAALLAILAAVVFAVANTLQRGAASVVPLEAGGPVRLVIRLLRAPRWLAGAGLAMLALLLHALALRRGSVIVVQSLLAAGLVVALGLEAAVERRRPRSAEVLGSALLVAGVVLVLAVGRPGGGSSVGTQEQLITAAVLLGLALTAFIGFRLHHRLRLSALVMGATAGACFAVDAVFLKGFAGNLVDLDAVPTVLDLAGFAAASALGNLVVQRGYQLAPLRFVLPAVTAGDPLAAFVIGKLVLGEHLQGGPWATTAVTAGLIAMATGITVTTTASAPPDVTTQSSDHSAESETSPPDGDDRPFRPDRRGHRP